MAKEEKIIIYANTIDTDECEKELISKNTGDILEINIVLEKNEDINQLLWIEKILKNIVSKQVNILLSNKYKLSKEALEVIQNILQIDNIGDYQEYGKDKIPLCCNIRPIKEYSSKKVETDNLISIDTIHNFKNLVIRKKTSLQLSKENNGEKNVLNSRKKVTEVYANDINYLTDEVLEILMKKSQLEINVLEKSGSKQYIKYSDIEKLKCEKAKLLEKANETQYEENATIENNEDIENRKEKKTTKLKITFWGRMKSLFKQIRTVGKHGKRLALPEPKGTD